MRPRWRHCLPRHSNSSHRIVAKYYWQLAGCRTISERNRLATFYKRLMAHVHGRAAGSFNINSLPDDVLLRIAALVEQSQPFEYWGKGSVQTLASFTEVCKAWCKIGRAAARRLVILCPQQRIRGPARRYICMCRQQRRQSGWDLSQHVVRLLRLLPNVKEVSLCGCISLQSLINAVASSERGTDQSLKHLEFRYCNSPFQSAEAPSISITRPSYVSGWKRIKRFFLRGSEVPIPKLVNGVGNWTCLTHLVLENCTALESLPSAVTRWTSIQSIQLSGCEKLESLPKEVGAWKALRSVSLHSSRKSAMHLPTEVRSWRLLERFKMSGGGAQVLPAEIGAWQNLTSFELWDCPGLQALPRTVGRWEKLQSVTLLKLPEMTELPGSIAGWKSLKEVFISDVGLRSLPQGIAGWGNLERLSLAGCNVLGGLPQAAGSWTKMRSLRIAECSAFTYLPRSLGSWSRLALLMLRNLAIEVLPDEIHSCTLLSKIYITNCPSLIGMDSHVEKWRQTEREYDITYDDPHKGIVRYLDSNRPRVWF